MWVLFDPSTLLHRTTELLGSKIIPAMECPERINKIVDAVERSSHSLVTIQSNVEDGAPYSVVQGLIRISHDVDYINHLSTVHDEWLEQNLIGSNDTILPECFPIKRLARHQDGQKLLSNAPKDVFARPGYYAFDMSAGISRGTWQAALASANLALEAVKLVTQHKNTQSGAVFALCRPPGHHCTTRLAGGYCYINNAVIAVDALRHFHSADAVPNIAILDLDFHHGNGTQDYYYADPTVLYVSVHGEDEYPYYSGSNTEVGHGAGRGYNCNLPVPADSSFESYSRCLDDALARVAQFEAAYLIVSMGFDTFYLDPLGHFQIYTEHYGKMAQRIRGHSALRSIPSVILLEGGYVLEHLGTNVCSFLDGWDASTSSHDGISDTGK